MHNVHHSKANKMYIGVCGYFGICRLVLTVTKSKKKQIAECIVNKLHAINKT